MYRLLIVDDEKEICENIKYLLNWQDYGFSVIMSATSYAEAANLAVDLNPHVALIDIKLGNHWGYELAEHLRSMGLKTVFCMISGFDDTQYIRRSMQASAQDYLLKPINTGELRAFVERTIVNELGGTLPESPTLKQEVDPVLKVEYSTLSKITNKIILVVKSNYRTPLTLTSIADSFQMSGKYIGRIFLKDTGIKFSDYLMAFRMLEARKLIVSTQEKISVIAASVGYVQLNHFYIHFKNYFGVSPSALRNFADTQEPQPEGGDNP